MRINRTYVGLDVHAWSVTGHGLDVETGEVWQRKLSPDPAEILAGVSTLPARLDTRLVPPAMACIGI